MDLRLFEAFLEVAERLHFGRAAERLGVSQPALSHQIRRLEDCVGAPLFDRTSRSVSLTDAGHALVPEARRTLVDFQRALAQTRNTAAGGSGHLSVGSIGAGLNSLTPLIVAEVRKRVVGVAVKVSQMDSPDQINALRNREIDVSVIRVELPCPGIRIEALTEEPMVVALPEGHALCQKTEISASQLRDESFVLWPHASGPAFHDQVIKLCAEAGFAPKVTMEGTDIETQLGLVSAGVGVSLQPASFANLRRRSVVWRRLTGEPPRTALQVAWCEPARTPLIAIFRDIAHELAPVWPHADSVVE